MQCSKTEGLHYCRKNSGCLFQMPHHSSVCGGAVDLELNVMDQQAQGAKLAVFLLICNKSLKIFYVMLEFKYKNLDKSKVK